MTVAARNLSLATMTITADNALNQPTRRRIVAHLKKAGGNVDFKEIRCALGISKQVLSLHCLVLETLGFITVTRRIERGVVRATAQINLELDTA